jgi:hypothetical protein
MRVVLLAGVLVGLVLPAEAAAGGWWSFPRVDREAAAAGQRVRVEADLLFASPAAARRAEAEGGYFVYALRNLDQAMIERAMTRAAPGDWWRLGEADAVELGPVAVSVTDSNLAHARASLVLPELPLGSHALMLCSAGCARPAADVVPARGFQVVADPVTARLVERAVRLDRRLAAQARRLEAARAATATLRRTSRASIRSLDDRLAALDRRVAAVQDAPETRAPLVAWVGWLVAGAVVGGLAVAALARRRGRRPGWPTDEDLQAFLDREGSRIPVSGRR